MNPIVAGSLISAGASIFGGESANRQNERFARNRIQWTVEDAKKAGIHPVFALGGGLPNVQDSLGAAISDAGQDIGRAVAARQTPNQRQADRLAMRKILSDIEETDARRDYYRSLTARETQEAMHTPGLPVTNASESQVMFDQPVVRQGGVQPGFVKPIAPDMPSVHVDAAGAPDHSRAAGDPPMWRAFDVGGFKMFLPAGPSAQPSEALESMSESLLLQLAVYRENVRRFGEQWGNEFIRRFVLPGWAGNTDEAVRGVASRFREWQKKFMEERGFKAPVFRPRVNGLRRF